MSGSPIFLGAVLGQIEGPSSAIAAAKMQGALPSADLLPMELQSLYVLMSIFVLGLISIFFVGEKAMAMELQISENAAAHRNAAIWGVRVCMFAGPLLLVGVAYGVDI